MKSTSKETAPPHGKTLNAEADKDAGKNIPIWLQIVLASIPATAVVLAAALPVILHVLPQFIRTGREISDKAEKLPAWVMLYENDASGKPIDGDVGLLAKAIDAGCPLRITVTRAPGFSATHSPEHVLLDKKGGGYVVTAIYNDIAYENDPADGHHAPGDYTIQKGAKFFVYAANTQGRLYSYMYSYTPASYWESNPAGTAPMRWFAQVAPDQLKSFKENNPEPQRD